VVQVPQLKKVFSGALSNMYCIMMSFIGEPPKTYSLSAWDLIKQEWLWEKSMKAFVDALIDPEDEVVIA